MLHRDRVAAAASLTVTKMSSSEFEDTMPTTPTTPTGASRERSMELTSHHTEDDLKTSFSAEVKLISYL